jgi:glycosyltransferase involved in cell wall biosynthesis
MAKSKHVVHLHGQPHATMNAGRSSIKMFIYNILEHYAMPKASLVIATDSITANLYATLYPVIKSRLIIIPTGVNLEEYNLNSNPVPFPGMLPSSSNLVYIGRLTYPKQVRSIIASFAKSLGNNSATHLWIAGTGRDEHQLRHQALQTGCSKNIHFTGHLTRESVKSLIHSSDAGILLSHNEGSPIIVKEFLACGKPVIVNNVGDISTYVTDSVNGFIVDPQQYGSVENAMMKILDQAKEMLPACRASMLPYNEEKIFEQVHEVLLDLMQN